MNVGDAPLVLGGVFVVHALAVATPGPNMLLVMHVAASEARRAGLLAAAGIAVGTALWGAAALVALALAYTQGRTAQVALRWVGALYLVHLGVRLWLRAGASVGAPSRTTGSPFVRGLLTNLTNPKALVFFGSVLAALLAPGLSAAVQWAAVAIMAANALAGYAAVAWLFSTPAAQQAYRQRAPVIDRTAGALLALLGLLLALLA